MIGFTLPTPRRIALAVVVGALFALGAALWLGSPAHGQTEATPLPTPRSSAELIADGREVFSDNCASCHGTRGEGTDFGPSLIGVGEVAADFMLRTGRMPLADPSEQAVRKPPAFDEATIEALVAYVGSLGNGPPIPHFSLADASLSEGEELFTINCAPCHGITGSGDAIGGPAFAPSLSRSSALDVQEAVRIGPGQMPKFGSVLDDPEIDDITKFVGYLHHQASPGGADLGLIGPVPEGFVAWFLGAGVIVVITILFVARGHKPEEEH
jgi:ubiquinol-cytochrome c reductase cytochrome c subunit